MAENVLVELLRKRGPMLSSDLSRLLESQYGLKPQAARQRVNRGGPGMTRLNHIVFPHRARFCYLQGEYGSPLFFERLTQALEKARSAYYPALQALALRDNMMPRSHFLIACGGPVLQNKHISAESILQRLVSATLIKEVVLQEGETYVVRCDFDQMLDSPHAWAKMRARLIAEKIALLAIKEWSRNLGLVSYNTVETREDEGLKKLPKVGTFNWDLAGPSYLFPMLEYVDKKPKPGFFVCDLALNGRVDVGGVSGFVKKCLTLRSLKKVGRCLQVFVAESYEPEAFALLKSHGIIPATTESLFGVEVASALKSLCATLTDTARLSKDPKNLDKIFNELSRIEGAASTLRGSLFEFVVAQIAAHTYFGYTQDTNRIVKDGIGSAAEIDVLAERPGHEVIFIECKGVHPLNTLDDAEIVKWLDKRIPVIRGFVKQNSDWHKLKQAYELWTNGKISDSGKLLVEAARAKHPKLKIVVRDGDGVLSQARESNKAGLLKAYRQHFVTHPLQEIEAAQKKEEQKAKLVKARVKAAVLGVPSVTDGVPPVPTSAP